MSRFLLMRFRQPPRLTLSHSLMMLGILVSGGLLTPGCHYPARGKPIQRLGDTVGLGQTDQRAFDTPRMRLGTQPFDTWYSPFIPIGVDQLGGHQYLAASDFPLRVGETLRGTVYTRRAGFLDIAHMRNSIDLTRFVYDHILKAFESQLEELRLLAAEPAVYVVGLNRPVAWDIDNPAHRERFEDAAIAIAGRVAYIMMSWHELATFYGYMGMGVVPETLSAFSFDDAPSHMVGVLVGMEAIAQDPSLQSFDARATAALQRRLRALDAQSAEQAEAAMRASEGTLWSNMEPLTRIVHMGLDDEPLRPYVLADVEPITWAFDGDERVHGARLDELYDLAIQPAILEAGAIFADLDRDGRTIRPRRDFPTLRRAIEQSMLEKGMIEARTFPRPASAHSP